MELSAEQIFVVGIVAVILVQAIKLYQARTGSQISREIITVVAYVISVVLAFVLLQPKLPPLTDPAKLAEAVISQAVVIFGFATLVYNLLLAKILEKMGLSATARAQKALVNRVNEERMHLEG